MLNVDQQFARFLVREPNKAYRGSWLWVPKDHVDVLALKAQMTVYAADGEMPLWVDTGTHIRVPRAAPWHHDVIDYSPEFRKVDLGDYRRITLRDEAQTNAWKALDASGGGILNLACGKGKTVMSLRKAAKLGLPTCVVVNQTSLLSQWRDEAVDKLGLNKNQIGVVQGPKTQWDKPLVIAMLNTVSNKASEWDLAALQRFGTVFFDECHHLSAPFFVRTAPLFWGSRYGLTATPEREDGTESIYQAHLGPVFYSDMSQDVPADIYFQELPTRIPFDEKSLYDKSKQFNWSLFWRYLGDLNERNDQIAEHIKLAASKGRRVLVLGHSIEGLKALSARVNESPVICSDVPAAKRVPLIKANNPAFATLQIAREALNVPELDTVFFTTPFKAWGWMVQGMGRAQRRDPTGKEKRMVAVVFEDVRFGPARGVIRKLKKQLVVKGHTYKTVTHV